MLHASGPFQRKKVIAGLGKLKRPKFQGILRTFEAFESAGCRQINSGVRSHQFIIGLFRGIRGGNARGIHTKICVW